MKNIFSLSVILLSLIILTACQWTNESSKEDVSFEHTKSAAQNSEDKGLLEIPPFDMATTTKETVLYENDGAKITLKELQFNEEKAKLLFELSNATDSDLQFVSAWVGHAANSINEFMSDDLDLDTTVMAGKSKEEIVDIHLDRLYSFGMDSIAEIIMEFSIHNNTEEIFTGPLVIKTSSYEQYDFSNNARLKDCLASDTITSMFGMKLLYSSEEKLYDANNIVLNSSYIFEDLSGGRQLNLEIVNNTDAAIFTIIENVLLNDHVTNDKTTAIKGFAKGKRGVHYLNINKVLEGSTELNLNMDEIKRVSFTLSFVDESLNEVSEPKKIDLEIK